MDKTEVGDAIADEIGIPNVEGLSHRSLEGADIRILEAVDGAEAHACMPWVSQFLDSEEAHCF